MPKMQSIPHPYRFQGKLMHILKFIDTLMAGSLFKDSLSLLNCSQVSALRHLVLILNFEASETGYIGSICGYRIAINSIF